MTPIVELLRLLDERRQFSLTITCEDDAWRISISDAVNEMHGVGETFEVAWFDLALIDLTDDIGPVLAQAQAWCDLRQAEEAAESAPSRADRAAYLAWLTMPDDDDILPSEMVLDLPG